MFSAMDYRDGQLKLIDQRFLPLEEVYVQCKDLETAAWAIEVMVVRGAPAIGCTAAFALAIAAHHSDQKNWLGFRADFMAGVERLRRTRPTAVNLFYALDEMQKAASQFMDASSIDDIRTSLTAAAQQLFDGDLATCRRIGDLGATLVPAGKKVKLITHCNTGSLATAGYGTALGIIRSLHREGKIEMVYVDETRPYLQGSRLTAYELKQEGIPFKLICDNAAAYVMRTEDIYCAIVGADRIAANGDTANKIGTYSLAVNCKQHNVKFFVAAPRTTFDPKLKTGADIPIEMRPAREITHIKDLQLVPHDIEVLNPSFDVTPRELITAIICEDKIF